MRLSYPRFLLANGAGAAAWTGLVVGAVVFVGAAAHRWVAGFGWVLLAVLVGVGALLARRVHRAFEQRVAAYAAAQARVQGSEPASERASKQASKQARMAP
jgi:membrane protein DedA with SNARE-associated domain